MIFKYIGSGALLIASLVFVDFIIHVTSFPSWTETAFSYVSLSLFPIGFLLIVIGLARDAKPSVEVPCEPEVDLSDLEFMERLDFFEKGFYSFGGENSFMGKVPNPAFDIEYLGTHGNIYYSPFNILDKE